MKKVLAILLVLVMVFGLAACGSNNNATPANNGNEAPVAEKKVLKVAFRGDPNGLCHVSIAVGSANTPAHELMMDRLFEYDYTTGTPTPMLATKWEPIDGTHFRVTLRDDVYSWNGDKFTASDVKYTVKAAIDSGKHARYYGNFDVDNFVVEDDTHLIFALKKVDPFIQTTLSNIPYGMIVEKSVQAGGGLEKMDGQGGNMPNCYTGPYKPVKWETGSSITFEKNEKYWGGEPYFDEIIIYSIADAQARTEALEAGNVDLVLEPSEAQASLIKENKDLAVYNYHTTNHHTLFTNTQKAPFDDANVRIACALALNYDANIQRALGGYGQHSDDILPLGNPMYEKPAESFYKFDLALAKEYMAKSSYAGKNPEVEIYYTPQHAEYVPLIQQQWAEIGITVVPTPIAQSAFYETMATGEKQAWIVNNSNPNPYEQLKFYDGEHFDYKALNGGPGWNGGAEVTALFDKITSEPDMEKARPYYQELRKIINAQVPSIPLYVYERLAFATNKLQGLILTEVGDINFSKCSFK
ncbi:MAG: ABC transporter substrate-binding protein [Firmicutes bacterium]|nr:ABC transporter substrate-binding protein [Bacillota bacterium]